MKENILNFDDERILNEIKLGNEEALEMLFERYYDSLIELSLYFLKNIQVAEEVVSDVFLKLWINREKIEIKQRLKSYLLVAVKNQSLNMQNKERRYFSMDLNSSELICDDNIEDSLHYSEIFDHVDNLISRMPPKRQLIFRLNRLEGMSYKEISSLLDISVETVQKHMTKAVQFMSEYRLQIKSLIQYFVATATLFIPLFY